MPAASTFLARFVYMLYPLVAGFFFGLLQTGLFFQLSFGLSSGFTTYLMVTLCWLSGSVVGLLLTRGNRILRLGRSIGLGLVAYYTCPLLLKLAPFQTGLWPVYALLVAVIGITPGVFFAQMATHYPARTLFFRENNGFIAGLIGGTLLFLLVGRLSLWIAPAVLATGLLVTLNFFDQGWRLAADRFLAA